MIFSYSQRQTMLCSYGVYVYSYFETVEICLSCFAIDNKELMPLNSNKEISFNMDHEKLISIHYSGFIFVCLGAYMRWEFLLS